MECQEHSAIAAARKDLSADDRKKKGAAIWHLEKKTKMGCTPSRLAFHHRPKRNKPGWGQWQAPILEATRGSSGTVETRSCNVSCPAETFVLPTFWAVQLARRKLYTI